MIPLPYGMWHVSQETISRCLAEWIGWGRPDVSWHWTQVRSVGSFGSAGCARSGRGVVGRAEVAADHVAADELVVVVAAQIRDVADGALVLGAVEGAGARGRVDVVALDEERAALVAGPSVLVAAQAAVLVRLADGRQRLAAAILGHGRERRLGRAVAVHVHHQRRVEYAIAVGVDHEVGLAVPVEVGVVARVARHAQDGRRGGVRRRRVREVGQDAAVRRVGLVVVGVADEAVDAGVDEPGGLRLGVADAHLTEHGGEGAFHDGQVAPYVALGALAEPDVRDRVREARGGRKTAGAVEHPVRATAGEHDPVGLCGELEVDGVLDVVHLLGVALAAERADEVTVDVVLRDGGLGAVDGGHDGVETGVGVVA